MWQYHLGTFLLQLLLANFITIIVHHYCSPVCIGKLRQFNPTVQMVVVTVPKQEYGLYRASLSLPVMHRDSATLLDHRFPWHAALNLAIRLRWNTTWHEVLMPPGSIVLPYVSLIHDRHNLCVFSWLTNWTCKRRQYTAFTSWCLLVDHPVRLLPQFPS